MEIMAKKMLIDATHAEETRVVVVEGNRVEEFDFESENRRQLAGNIYLAKVTRIEPSLQAAFIDYGGNRHGFLAFSEIHPDYYQIPVADREALMAEERAYSEAMRRKDEEEESDDVAGTDLLTEEGENADAENSKISESEIIDERKISERVGKKSKKKPSKGKPKPTAEKPKSSRKNKIEKEDVSGEEIVSTEKKVEKKPRGRPKKSPKPIAADIDTDSKDEVIQSEELDGVESEVKSNIEVSQSNVSNIKKRPYRRRSRKKNDDNPKNSSRAADEESDLDSLDKKPGLEIDPKKEIEAVSEIDDVQEIRHIRKPRHRRYKIQEVIKVRQIMLVQVVKEERGNKGAALTTYLSLAGRYCVLMPNTARGGGISLSLIHI